MQHTVRALSTVELDYYRKALKKRANAVQGFADSRLELARKVAVCAVALLKKDFAVTKVAVFGSLSQPALFHSRSDVDLAVWGLAEKDYFRAVGVLQSLDADMEVDLVMFETASKSMQETILRDGKEL